MWKKCGRAGRPRMTTCGKKCGRSGRPRMTTCGKNVVEPADHG